MAKRLLDAEGALRLPPGPGRLRILLAGDLCPIGRVASMLTGGRLEDAFGRCLESFRRSNLAVVNLESPLCAADSPIPKSGPTFRCDVRAADALAAGGVDVACLANNHILDQGPAGLAETVAALDAAGVRHLGAGDSLAAAAAPLLLTVNDVRLALLNFAEGEFARSDGGAGAAGLDPVANVRAVAAAAAQADAVLAVVHGGNEQVLFPSPGMQRRCRELIDAGAAAVVCHHPHVPQGVEIYRGRPIAYSLGNFLFDWPEPEPETDSGFLLVLDIGPAGVGELAVLPFRKSSRGGAELLAGGERADYLSLLNDLSRPLSDADRMRRLWEQQCVWLLEHRYDGQLRRVATLLADGGDRPRAALTAFNLLHCEAHREALTTIARLSAEERLRPVEPEAGMLADLMDRLKRFAPPAATAD